MPLRLLSVALVLVLCISASAVAQETPSKRWRPVTEGAQVTVYVDMESMKRMGTKVKVWTMWLYTVPKQTDDLPPKTYQMTKNLTLYNCTDGSANTTQLIKYKDSGGMEVADSVSYPEKPEGYSYVVPETMNEAVLNFACTYTSQPKPAAATK